MFMIAYYCHYEPAWVFKSFYALHKEGEIFKGKDIYIRITGISDGFISYDYSETQTMDRPTKGKDIPLIHVGGDYPESEERYSSFVTSSFGANWHHRLVAVSVEEVISALYDASHTKGPYFPLHEGHDIGESLGNLIEFLEGRCLPYIDIPKEDLYQLELLDFLCFHPSPYEGSRNAFKLYCERIGHLGHEQDLLDLIAKCYYPSRRLLYEEWRKTFDHCLSLHERNPKVYDYGEIHDILVASIHLKCPSEAAYEDFIEEYLDSAISEDGTHNIAVYYVSYFYILLDYMDWASEEEMKTIACKLICLEEEGDMEDIMRKHIDYRHHVDEYGYKMGKWESENHLSLEQVDLFFKSKLISGNPYAMNMKRKIEEKFPK